MKCVSFITKCWLILFFSLYTACSNDDKDQTSTNVMVEEPKPDDSTGKTGTVNLTIGSNNSSLTILNKDIGDGIDITAARINIDGFKIKTKKEPTEDEAKLDVLDKKDEVAAIAELDLEVDETT